MSGFRDDGDEDDGWSLRPVWEDDPEDLVPPGSYRTPSGLRPLPGGSKAPSAADLSGSLLHHLSEADALLGALDAAVAAAPEAIRDGLLARMVFREASGWLASLHRWVHPHDLTIRDMGLTGSYTAAAHGNLLHSLPNTLSAAENEDASTVPEDRMVHHALALTRALRRLVESSAWRPLDDARAVGRAMEPLGLPDFQGEIAYLDWQERRADAKTKPPPLLDAVEAAVAWRRADDEADADLRAGFVAAAMLRHTDRLRAMPLPVWTGRLALRGMQRIDGPFVNKDEGKALLLRGIAEGAGQGLAELARLKEAHGKTQRILTGRRSTSRIGDAVDLLVRSPCLTPLLLQKRLRVTKQAARRLLNELQEAGVAREGTGRRSYRAFIL